MNGFTRSLIVITTIACVSLYAGNCIQSATGQTTHKTPLPYPDFEVVNEYQVTAYHQFLVETLGVDAGDKIRELRTRAHERANELLKKGQEMYDLPQQPLTFIKWDIKSGHLYGEAYCEQNIIGLNEVFYLQHTEGYLNDVIPHEVAHLIHGQRDGCEVYNTNYIPAMHLPPFPEIMEALGGKDDLIKNPDTELLCHFRHELLKARVMTEVCDSCTISIMGDVCPALTVKVSDYKIKTPQ
jgi:hypothetical protein